MLTTRGMKLISSAKVRARALIVVAPGGYIRGAYIPRHEGYYRQRPRDVARDSRKVGCDLGAAFANIGKSFLTFYIAVMKNKWKLYRLWIVFGK